MNAKKHIYAIEGARGLAAYYILFHHAFFLVNNGQYFSTNWAIRLIHDFSAGFPIHILMMFFLLSGFSIHYANYGRIQSFEWASFKSYYYKRIRRIYPIYLLAVALSLIAIIILQQLQPENNWTLPARIQLSGTILLFSDLESRSGTWVPTLSTNGPLWSLSYEALYYLLYPFFSVMVIKKGMFTALWISVAISAVAVLFASIFGPTQISNMLSLYVLWCLGAFIAALKIEGRRFHFEPINIFVLTFVWAQGLWIFATFLLWRIPMGFYLYAGIFIFLVMLNGVVGVWPDKWSTRDRFIGCVSAVGCSAVLLYVSYRFGVTQNFEFLWIRMGLTLLIGLLWLFTKPASLFNWIKRCFNRWHSTGVYSYGLYVLQFPLMIIAYVFAEKYLGSVLWGFASIGLAVLVAKLVEQKLQPEIARYLDSVLRSHQAPPARSSVTD